MINSKDMPILYDGYVLRTPLIPYEKVTNINETAIRDTFQNPEIQEAIFIASPEFYELLMSWLVSNSVPDKENEKMIISLTKYLLRMSYRCTPYGSFAGVSLGQLQQTNNINIDEEKSFKSYKIDHDCLSVLIGKILDSNEIRSKLKYFMNNTIYKAVGKYRYIEYKTSERIKSYRLSTFEDNTYINNLLERAYMGATIEELASTFKDDEIDRNEVIEFINELINNQIIVSDLEPSLTGGDNLLYLKDKLREVAPTSIWSIKIEVLHNMFIQLNESNVQDRIKIYKNIMNFLKDLEIDFDENNVFHIDMYRSTKINHMDKKTTESLTKAIDFLSGISGSYNYSQDNMVQFIQKFIERYGDQEVALNHVLDPEIGIGYPVQDQYLDILPLLDDIKFPNTTLFKREYYSSAWSKFLSEKFTEVIKSGNLVMKLSYHDVKKFINIKKEPLPYSMYSIGSILVENSKDNDFETLVYHHVSGGPSAANLISRFCHLSESLRKHVEIITKDESSKLNHAVIAEIVHADQLRTSNILNRPIFHEYEIPIVTRSGVSQDKTVLLDELMISIVSGSIVLRSVKLNKEIIPRLSTAHNFSYNSLPHYRLLCDIQLQNVQSVLSWDWGNLSENVFLPRVQLDNIILSKAQWNFNDGHLKEIINSESSDLNSNIYALLNRYNVPSRITIAEGEASLPLDLTNNLCQRIFQKFTKKYKNIIVEENIFDQKNLIVKGDSGFYTNEFIVGWQNNNSYSVQNRFDINDKLVLPTRRFVLGSEWVYVKIYSSINTISAILSNVISPIVESLINQQIITKWFFVRYYDPEPHIRIRFRGNVGFHDVVIKQIFQDSQWYVNNDLIRRIEYDTYEREIERYGYENIDDSESIFYFDSVAVLKVNSLLLQYKNENLRWIVCIRNIDMILDDFRFELPSKMKILEELRDGFMNEFGIVGNDAKQTISNKQRSTKNIVNHILGKDISTYEKDIYDLIYPFEERRYNWLQTVSNILERSKSKELKIPIEKLVKSYIHMSINRLLTSKQRLQETIIYEFTFHYYRSLLAKGKQDRSSP